MANITIGCRLPHGIVLEVGGKIINILGLNRSLVIGAEYMANEVDSALWNAWAKENEGSKLLTSGALFAASSEKDAKAKAKELKSVKTGLEPVDPDSMGVKTVEA